MLGLAVMKKDLFEETRRPRKYILRTLYGGVLLAAMASVLLAGSLDRPRLAQELFEAVATIQFFMISSLSIVLGTTGLGNERSRGTLGLLVLSKLTSFDIVAGAWLGRVVGLMALLACGLPFFVAIPVFGGVMLRQVLAVFLITACSTALAAALGTFFSLVTRNLFLNIFLGAAALAALFWAPPGAYPYENLFPLRTIEYVFTSTFPSFTDILPAALGALAASIVLLACAALLVPRAARAGSVPRLASFLDAVDAKIKVFLPHLYHKKKISHDYRNPITWREGKCSGVGRRRHLVKLVIAGCYVLVVLFLIVPLKLEAHRVLITIEALALMLLASFIGAVTISREKESGSMLLLLLTMLTPGRIIAGKVTAGTRVIAYMLVVPIIHTMMLVMFELVHCVSIPAVAVTLFAALLFFFLQGLLVALFTRNTTKALATVMVIVALQLGTFKYGAPFMFSNPYYLGTRALVTAGDKKYKEKPVIPKPQSDAGIVSVYKRDAVSDALLFSAKALGVDFLLIAALFSLIGRFLEPSMRRHLEQSNVYEDAIAEIFSKKRKEEKGPKG
jgi:ABC-type transport system involved in multi-copper enzyme maturation permease subunit